MARRCLAFIAAALLLAGPAVAADQGMAGTWAFKSGGRIVMLLRLHGTSGVLERPQHANFSGGEAVSGIGPPVIAVPLQVAASSPDTVRLREPDPDNPSQVNILDLRRTGPERAELTVEGIPIAAMPFVRVGPDAKVDATPGRAVSEVPDNPQMTRIFQEDQAARQGQITTLDWATISKADAGRRTQVRALLAGGELRSASDFLHAGFVFQHGDTPGDFLLAHTLAVIALRKGSDEATWLAAATLDRYLQKIGQPQVYGAQFRTGPDKSFTQDPYDRTLIPDSLRALLGVPDQAAQDLQRKAYQTPANAP